MNRRDKQRTAASHPALTFPKHKDVYTASEYQEALAQKEQGEGGLQSRVSGWLREVGTVSLRLPDALYNSIYNSSWLPEWLRRKILAAIKGWPDDTILIPIDGTPFNLAICCEHKSKIGKLRRSQRDFADKVNVNVTRNLEHVQQLHEQGFEFIRDIQPMIDNLNEEEQ